MILNSYFTLHFGCLVCVKLSTRLLTVGRAWGATGLTLRVCIVTRRLCVEIYIGIARSSLRQHGFLVI